MQETVLVTGVTGLVGSALAAALLRSGARVIALARGAPSRATSAIDRAAAGFGTRLTPAQRGALIVAPPDLEALASEHSRELGEVTYAWHAAAEMSFLPDSLDRSFQFNVGWTMQLYQLLAKSSGCRRLHYVSTAYSGGLATAKIREEIHLAPRLVTPYLITKWAAEMALEKASRGTMPVTLFRPSLIVGHTATGWYGGKSFGPYNFVDALRLAKSLGGTTLRSGLEPSVVHNYIPIDDLVHNALALSHRHESSSHFEIVHCLGTDVANQLALDEACKLLGLQFRSAPPETAADRTVAAFLGPALWFSSAPYVVGRIPLESTVLERLLGADHQRTLLDAARCSALFGWYLANTPTP